MTPKESLSRWRLSQYSILALPLSFGGLPLYIHAPDHYATQAGLSLLSIGSVILFIRFFDAVQDPLIGLLLHRFTRYRVPIIGSAVLAMTAGFILLFHIPHGLTNLQTLGWFTASLVLATSGLSVLLIAMGTFGSLWHSSPYQKSRITAWREGFGLCGLLLAAILPALLDLSDVALILSGALVLSSLFFLTWTQTHRNILESRQTTGSFPVTIKDSVAALKPPAILYPFFGIYSLSMLASAIPAALVLFYIRDYLRAESLTGFFLILYFVSGAAGLPLWVAVGRRKGLAQAWLGAIILSAGSFIWVLFLDAGDIIPYGIICVLSGFALGAELALPPALLSVLLEKEDNRNHTYVSFSYLSFLSKAALALGSSLAFLVCGLAAFVPADPNNTPAALLALVLTYALLPCALKMTAGTVLAFWIHRQKPPHTHRSHDNDPSFSHHPYHGGHNDTQRMQST